MYRGLFGGGGGSGVVGRGFHRINMDDKTGVTNT